MPVFFRVQGDVITVTVDGDFTPGELARKGTEALEHERLPSRVGVLLDVSGAAGTDASEVIDMAHVFVEHATEVPRIAVLGAVETTTAAGVEIRGFYRRAEALEWLAEASTGSP
jgi:hypothetical protein